jgi:hypothetical protein
MRTAKLYERRSDKITLDEVERIVLWGGAPGGATVA